MEFAEEDELIELLKLQLKKELQITRRNTRITPNSPNRDGTKIGTLRRVNNNSSNNNNNASMQMELNLPIQSKDQQQKEGEVGSKNNNNTNYNQKSEEKSKPKWNTSTVSSALSPRQQLTSRTISIGNKRDSSPRFRTVTEVKSSVYTIIDPITAKQKGISINDEYLRVIIDDIEDFTNYKPGMKLLVNKLVMMNKGDDDDVASHFRYYFNLPYHPKIELHRDDVGFVPISSLSQLHHDSHLRFLRPMYEVINYDDLVADFKSTYVGASSEKKDKNNRVYHSYFGMDIVEWLLQSQWKVTTREQAIQIIDELTFQSYFKCTTLAKKHPDRSLFSLMDQNYEDLMEELIPSDSLYTWGDGVLLPQLSSLQKVIQVACGSTHILALIATGGLLAWGNGESGQLGLGELMRTSTPKFIPEFDNKEITKISASRAQSAAVVIDHSGRTRKTVLYKWGWFGKHTAKHPEINFPEIFENLETTHIAMGCYHTLTLSRDKSGQHILHSWGSNKFGQLGIGDVESKYIESPRVIENLSGHVIISISAGDTFSACVTVSGYVLVWGGNQDGVLGSSETKMSPIPVIVKMPERIREVACGSRHAIAISQSGNAYSWGYGASGRLGHNSETSSSLPKRIENLPPVAQISVGHNHSLAATGDGTIWVWGDGNLGKLGRGNSENALVPSPLTIACKLVLKLVAGGNFSAALVVDDHLKLLSRAGKKEFGLYPIEERKILSILIDCNSPALQPLARNLCFKEESLKQTGNYHFIRSVSALFKKHKQISSSSAGEKQRISTDKLRTTNLSTSPMILSSSSSQSSEKHQSEYAGLFHIHISKYKLDFGLGVSNAPMYKYINDSFTITNKSKNVAHYHLSYAPDPRLNFILKPHGAVDKMSTIKVEVQVMILEHDIYDVMLYLDIETMNSNTTLSETYRHFIWFSLESEPFCQCKEIDYSLLKEGEILGSGASGTVTKVILNNDVFLSSSLSNTITSTTPTTAITNVTSTLKRRLSKSDPSADKLGFHDNQCDDESGSGGGVEDGGDDHHTSHHPHHHRSISSNLLHLPNLKMHISNVDSTIGDDDVGKSGDGDDGDEEGRYDRSMMFGDDEWVRDKLGVDGKTVVAVKKFRVIGLNNEDIDTFRREIIIASNLSHPNIVDCLGVSTGFPNMCIVFEYFPLGDLRNILNNVDDLSIPLLLKISFDISNGMKYLHSRKIIHRDLKPDNVMIASLELQSKVNAKVTDFGAAKMMASTRENLSQDVGTVRYMPPEVINRAKKSTKNSEKIDVYSFGIVLWELFTGGGAMAYSEYNFTWQICEAVVGGERPLITPKIPKKIADLMQSCWATSPKHRPFFPEIVDILYDELVKLSIPIHPDLCPINPIMKISSRRDQSNDLKSRSSPSSSSPSSSSPSLSLSPSNTNYEELLNDAAESKIVKLTSEIENVKTEINDRKVNLAKLKNQLALISRSIEQEKTALRYAKDLHQSLAAELTAVSSCKDRKLYPI